MSMDFSQYTYDGVLSNNLHYVNSTQMYDKTGFNHGVQKALAFSGSKMPVSGCNFSTFDQTSVSKVVNPTNILQANIKPMQSVCGGVYHFPTYAETAVFNDMQVNGYSTSRRTVTAPTNISNYSLYNNAVKFYAEFKPNRTALIIARNQTLTWAGTTMQTAEWGKYIKPETWDIRDVRQWVLTSTIANVIRNSYFRYDTRENVNPYSGVSSDFIQDTKNRFCTYIDDGVNLAAFTYGSKGGTGSPAGQISYNKSTGAFTWIPTTASNDLQKAGYQTWSGKYPFASFTRDDFFNHWNITTQYAPGTYLLYVAGKLWHYDRATYKLLDIEGNEMPETAKHDLQQGAYWLYLATDTAATATVFVYPTQHISQMFMHLSSFGIPFSAPTAAVYAPVISDVGDGTGSFYQNPIGANGFTGTMYYDLYKNASKYQGFTDQTAIDLKPIDSIPITETPIIPPPLFYIGAGTEVYAISQSELNTAVAALFNAPSTIVETIDKYNSTLAESIKSILVYPFSIPRVVNTVAGNIVFHGEQLLSDAGRVRQATGVYDMGQYTVQDNGVYTDYSPYCTYYLYLPYCGFNKLDARDVVGKTISIKYVIDILSGACTANVFRDGVLIRSESGQIGVQVPVTSRDFTAMTNGLINAGINAGTAVSSAFMQNPIAAVMAATNVATGLDKLTETTLQQRGVATSAASFAMPQYAFIVKVSAKEYSYEGYAHDNGIACLKTAAFNTFSGFTVFQNVDTSGIPLTNAELSELKNMMESGIYINL